MDFETWFKYGSENGWISDVFCKVHDSGEIAMTDEEAQELYNGNDDQCMYVVRVWELD